MLHEGPSRRRSAAGEKQHIKESLEEFRLKIVEFYARIQKGRAMFGVCLLRRCTMEGRK